MHSAFVSCIKPKILLCTHLFLLFSHRFQFSLIAHGRSIMLIALRLHLNFPWDSRLDKAIMNPMWLWDYGLFQCALLSTTIEWGIPDKHSNQFGEIGSRHCRRFGKLENAFYIVEHQLPNAVLRVKVIVVNLDIFLSSLKAKHEERSRHSSFCARDRRPK